MSRNEKVSNRQRNHTSTVFGFAILFMAAAVVILPLFGERWFGPPAKTQADDTAEIDKELLEFDMRTWLNERVQARGLDTVCTRVSLVRESETKYVGLAEFDNGSRISVEAIADGNGVLFRAENMPSSPRLEPTDSTKPELHHATLATVVRNTTLPAYPYTTIGKAFDTFFADPHWEEKVTENETNMVQFTGQMKSRTIIRCAEALSILLEEGDHLRFRFAIHQEYGIPQLYSMQIQFTAHDDPNSPQMRTWSLDLHGVEIMYGRDWTDTQFIDATLNRIYEID